MIDMAQWTEVYTGMVKELDPRPSRPVEVLSWPPGGVKGVILDVNALKYGEVGETRDLLENVADRFRVVVTTDCSRDALVEELAQLGLLDLVTNGKIRVVGVDEVGGAGRTPEFYGSVAGKLGLSPRECLAVVDDFGQSGFSAIGAGMGSMVVNQRDGLRQLLGNELVKGHVLAKKFDVGRYLMDMYRPGRMTIIGVVGRNAAGKSSRSEEMVNIGQQMRLPVALLSLEVFHIRGRKERAAWLAEVRDTNPEEYAHRCDEDSWFDWHLMQQSLEALKAKQSLHLEGVYDMSLGGEKVGRLDIPIDPNRGAVIIFEGVAVDHLSDFMDEVIYITAHPNNRLEKLFERDRIVRSMEELTERLQFYTRWDLKHLLVQRDRVTKVLSNDGEDLVELPLMVPLL